MNILDKRATNPAAALDGTELVYVAQLGADAVTTVQDIKDFATNGVFSDATFRIQDNADATKQLAFEVSGIATGTTRTITMPDANVDLGQTGKGSFTPKELLASSGSQNLEANYSYYLPAFYAGALNLVMPASAAIGTTFDIGSIYSNGIDGTLGANLTALNLTIPAGEFITGWGVDEGLGATFNLLVSYVTTWGGYTTPNFTQGCTFRLTKIGATSWAIKPTFGSVLPKRFLVKNEGGVGGTVVSTTVPAGTYRELTLPDADVDLGTLPSVATAYGTLTAGQTRCQIIGGSGNTVGATAVDCILTGCTSVTAYGTRNQFNNCTNWVLNATHAGTDNIFNRCTGDLTQTMYVDSIGVTYNNCTRESLYGLPTSYGAQSPWTNYSTVEGIGVGGGVRITKQTATLTGKGAGAIELVARGAHGASFGVLGNSRINTGVKAYHRIQIFGGDSGGNVYRMTADRKVVISQGVIASNSTLDVDIADAGSTYTVTISVATGYLTVTITPNSAQDMDYIATVISEYVA